jgi:DNA-binding NtrC family response regulator
MTAAEALNTKPGNHRSVILVVEDEPGIREFLCTYLTSKSFKVLTAPDAERALEIWQARSGEIDLLLTDMVMPGLNGKELAAKLLIDRPELKVIYMSGYSPCEYSGETPSGIFFKKPFHPVELLETIREILH